MNIFGVEIKDDLFYILVIGLVCIIAYTYIKKKRYD